MKQATQIVITGYEGIRLTIALEAITEKQEGKLTDKAIQFYKSLIYQLHNEDELERAFYEEQNFNVDFNDEVDTDQDDLANDNYEEDYEFDYHRHK